VFQVTRETLLGLLEGSWQTLSPRRRGFNIWEVPPINQLYRAQGGCQSLGGSSLKNEPLGKRSARLMVHGASLPQEVLGFTQLPPFVQGGPFSFTGNICGPQEKGHPPTGETYFASNRATEHPRRALCRPQGPVAALKGFPPVLEQHTRCVLTHKIGRPPAKRSHHLLAVW